MGLSIKMRIEDGNPVVSSGEDFIRRILRSNGRDQTLCMRIMRRELGWCLSNHCKLCIFDFSCLILLTTRGRSSL